MLFHLLTMSYNCNKFESLIFLKFLRIKYFSEFAGLLTYGFTIYLQFQNNYSKDK